MIYAFICTRSKNFSNTTNKLSSYLSRAGVKTKFLVGQKSIFSGYSNAFKKFNVQDNDIVIMCHDDIEILTDPEVFKNIIVNTCLKVDTGFIGVAGTTHLTENAVWWNQDIWRQGKHRGHVYHGSDILTADSTYYGRPNMERVVCMDGLFLAASGRVLRDVGLDKPKYFEGDWDFYDIHYTVTAHKKKYKNHVVPISLLHNSKGELAGRDSWHKNREAFIKNTQLPIFLG
jgi:hypothetical protein